MSLYSVAKKLTGFIPGTPMPLALDSTAEALETIYRQTDWHFQKGFNGAWLAPGIVFNTGTFTCTQYEADVIADASVTAQLLAYSGRPFVTEMQFRNMAYSIYDIIAYDDGQTVGQGNYPFATLTLSRPWMEPIEGPGIDYVIYQCYFVGPAQNFNKFISFQDFTNDQDLDWWSMTQARLAVEDPQRTDFSIPEYVVPFDVDQRPNSATLGWPRFELWPHQGNPCPYNFGYRQLGPMPQQPSDFLSMSTPYPVSEKMVEWRAREILCQYKEAQKGTDVTRGAGANWMMLSQMAQKEYSFLLGQAIALDLNLDGEALTRVPRRRSMNGSYATMNGGLNLGSYPERN